MGTVFSVIAGKMRKSHFIYKVNGHAKLVWRQIKQNGNTEKIDESGPGKGTEVTRIASQSAIRRSA